MTAGGGDGCTEPAGLTQAQFRRRFHYRPPQRDKGGPERLWRSCRPDTACVSRCLRRRLPILAWLPAYRYHDDLFGDVIAGTTVAIMHIPQGMAYALLAGIPAIHGLYMAFFQCLVYAVMGTSRHLSVGTFAVTCIMTGKVVVEYSGPAAARTGAVYDPVLVATTVTLAVGIIQLVLFSVRLTALAVVLSEMLVQGFTTGAAVHVLLSQVPSLLGLERPLFSGPGRLLKLTGAIIQKLATANTASIVISATTIVILVLNNELVKPRLAKWTRVPFPIELLVVLVGTLGSYLGDLSGRYEVQVIGNVTTGLPQPSSPSLVLLPRVLLDSAVIAVVTYSAGLSMAQLLATKHGYTVDASQEMLAQGVGNLFSAWFLCAPMAASLSRSLIVDGTGGRTQASGIITALLLLAVLLWLGPLFSLLPKCVLSAVIVVSLKGLLSQLVGLPALWRSSRADALVWTGTLLAVVLIDIAAGLAVGVLLSLGVLLWRLQRPPAELLGRLPGSQYYVSLERYQAAEPVPEVCVFRFGGALHFCNVDYFRRRLATLTGLERARLSPTERHVTSEHNWCRPASGSRQDTEDRDAIIAEEGGEGSIQLKFSWLVLDMSRVSFTDSTSTRALLATVRDYQELGVHCCLAGCTDAVLDMLHSCRSPLEEKQMYPTVQDAVSSIFTSETGQGNASEHCIER
ncbi:sulfate anion transporter 1-like isoform X2 [Amphibalanus amphitrite]|uniref:sulfate anion transporter 1-like isoform X2 n=1 Tax=Amphibalanus amphitrite TaxID=1232801 RepID=UPI001C91621E|nr:sulfate anion transporter 1-like isoform X2 [Amphibalanus amphitrite]